jgi:hypothetical protein
MIGLPVIFIYGLFIFVTSTVIIELMDESFSVMGNNSFSIWFGILYYFEIGLGLILFPWK